MRNTFQVVGREVLNWQFGKYVEIYSVLPNDPFLCAFFIQQCCCCWYPHTFFVRTIHKYCWSSTLILKYPHVAILLKLFFVHCHGMFLFFFLCIIYKSILSGSQCYSFNSSIDLGVDWSNPVNEQRASFHLNELQSWVHVKAEKKSSQRDEKFTRQWYEKKIVQWVWVFSIYKNLPHSRLVLITTMK